MGSVAVICPDSLIQRVCKSFVCLLSFFAYFLYNYLLPYLSASLRIGPFHYHPEVTSDDQTWLYFCFILCCIFCYGCTFAFVVLDLVQQYLANRLAGKNISNVTFVVSGWT